MKEKTTPPNAIFRFDRAKKELSADGVARPLSPKATDLLLFLVEKPGEVVTRAELVESVWGGLAVSNDAVRYAMKALRRALGDPAMAPLFIETVAHRGWRLVARVVRVSEESWILEGRDGFQLQPAGRGRAARDPFVGREVEMGSLIERLSQAQGGHPQTLFVRGEPGIGKSRLLDAFLEIARTRPDTLAVRGDCIEHIGPGMPYAPLFRVLEQLCEGDLAVAMLRRHAPTWLSQMPSLTDPKDRASLEEQAQGATQSRMVREWANVLERLAGDQTIVIALEDLQWADESTLSALFFLAQRDAPTKVMVLATLRAEASVNGAFDLQQSLHDLERREYCEILSPSIFGTESVRAYLASRFGGAESPCQSDTLCEGLVQASAGNPLFLASLVDESVEEGVIKEDEGRWTVAEAFRLESVPESLKPLIERQLSGLAPRLRGMLEVASVVGLEFSAAELASALDREIEEVESDCDELVDDGRFVSGGAVVAWPDGTLSSGYRFKHGLHREVLYGLLSAGRRSRLHRTVAERLREAFEGREEAVAAGLAMHFEQGLDLASASQFYARAGDASARCFANSEAVGHFRQALKLAGQTDFEGQGVFEISTRLAFCAPLAAVAGYAASELEENLRRLEVLTADIKDSSPMFPALLGLWSLNFVRADFDRARILGDRMLALADQESSGAVRLQAYQSAGHCLFYRGQVVEAQEHYEESTRGYSVKEHLRQDYWIGDDPLVLMLACQGLSCWFLGRSDEACESAEAAVREGKRLEHPPSLALAWTYGAVLHQLRNDVARAWEWSDRGLEITTAEGIPFWMDLCRIVRGWSVARADPARKADGIELIRTGIAGWGATGSSLGLPHFLSLLASCLGSSDEALDNLNEARRLMEETGQWVFESEINRLSGDFYRQRGESNRGNNDLETARSWYLRAAEIAESRSLRAPALQAWMSLGELGGAKAKVERRLRNLVALYPANVETDLHLEQARHRLSR
ncbi:MAG: AAA family ATPase [Myxococcota bacterium]